MLAMVTGPPKDWRNGVYVPADGKTNERIIVCDGNVIRIWEDGTIVGCSTTQGDWLRADEPVPVNDLHIAA